ncbi:MAG: substrate-binding domain-containing protein, partial [Ktedonobacteraceae bacterium]|nr:substrate-binding domain-containing protein [Ktedonobacteraceae bacterium]
IPDDVSVISFDNAELAAFTEPPLTTIDFDFSQQNAMAINYLIELLNDPDMILHQRVLLPNLVVRASTRKLDADDT